MISKQDSTEGHDSERAVSPVIGVILMVAITVILAAVIGTFVLGMADDVGDSAPQASVSVQDHPDAFSGAQGANAVRIRHSGGAELPAEGIRIQVRHAGNNSLVSEWDGTWSPDTVQDEFNGDGSGLQVENYMANGDQITIQQGNSQGLASDNRYSIRFIHKETGDTIAESTVTLR